MENIEILRRLIAEHSLEDLVILDREGIDNERPAGVTLEEFCGFDVPADALVVWGLALHSGDSKFDYATPVRDLTDAEAADLVEWVTDDPELWYHFKGIPAPWE